MVIASEGYQDTEYGNPKEIFENLKHTVVTTSTTLDCKGSKGGSVRADILLKDVKSDDYDVIVFVGGPGSHQYFNDPLAHKIAREFYEKNKLTCAICAGPGILASAGILEGKNATSFPGIQELLIKAGATPTGNPVEKDGTIITADGPTSARTFGETIAQYL